MYADMPAKKWIVSTTQRYVGPLEDLIGVMGLNVFESTLQELGKKHRTKLNQNDARVPPMMVIPPPKKKQNLIRIYIEVTYQKKRETSNPTRIVLFLYIWWIFVEASYPWSIWFRKLGPTLNPSSLAWRCVSGSSSQQCRVANNTGQHWGALGREGLITPVGR